MNGGFFGLNSTAIRLPAALQGELVNIASENRAVASSEAQAFFHRHLNFSSIHTLSLRDPVLRDLAELPIEVPFTASSVSIARGRWRQAAMASSSTRARISMAPPQNFWSRATTESRTSRRHKPK
jgi:hypothetical protein